MLKGIAETLLSPQFVAIFVTSLGVVALKVIAKYITKLPALGAKDPPPTQAQRSAIHFECLRTVGLDLAFLGLVTFFAVCGVALKGPLHSRPEEFLAAQALLLNILFGLVMVSAILTALFPSPEPRMAFWKGVLIPFLPGWLSFCVSAAAYRLVTTGGL